MKFAADTCLEDYEKRRRAFLKGADRINAERERPR
jgi:hypothetical protein